MRDGTSVAQQLVDRLCAVGEAQVLGYNRFEYVSHTSRGVKVKRIKGTTTLIPFSRIARAVDAVRSDLGVYDRGPAALRKFGITHVTSPIWAILHLESKEQLLR